MVEARPLTTQHTTHMLQLVQSKEVPVNTYTTRLCDLGPNDHVKHIHAPMASTDTAQTRLPTTRQSLPTSHAGSWLTNRIIW
jgi:hypothetical protein